MVTSLGVIVLVALIFITPAFAQLGPDDTHIGTPSPVSKNPLQVWQPPERPPDKPTVPIRYGFPPGPPIDPMPPIVISQTSDEGDPLVFSFGDTCTYKTYPDEMHSSRLTQTDLYNNGKLVTLSRNLCVGSYFVMLDKDLDGKLTNGNELLFTNGIVYDNLAKYDSNSNGFFDYADDWAPYARLLDHNGNLHPLDKYGIIGFSTQYTKTFDDMHGSGRYADCLYEGKKYYPICETVSSESGFRIKAYNLEGIVTNHGVYPSYGAMLGHS